MQIKLNFHSNNILKQSDVRIEGTDIHTAKFQPRHQGPDVQNFVSFIIKTSTREVNADYIGKYTVIFVGESFALCFVDKM